MSLNEYINVIPKIYNGKYCAICSGNGNTRRNTYYFNKTYKAKVCEFCIRKLFNTSQEVCDWLADHAKYDNNGHLLNFSKRQSSKAEASGSRETKSPAPYQEEI